MSKILVILLLLVGCTQQPTEKTLQVDYIQNDEIKHIFLNVIEVEEDCYEVQSQEYIGEEPEFVIINIFDYNQQ